MPVPRLGGKELFANTCAEKLPVLFGFTHFLNSARIITLLFRTTAMGARPMQKIETQHQNKE